MALCISGMFAHWTLPSQWLAEGRGGKQSLQEAKLGNLLDPVVWSEVHLWNQLQGRNQQATVGWAKSLSQTDAHLYTFATLLPYVVILTRKWLESGLSFRWFLFLELNICQTKEMCFPFSHCLQPLPPAPRSESGGALGSKWAVWGGGEESAGVN